MFSYRFGHVLRIGFRSLGAHRLRSGLTALGIVLGVASVIVMLAIGEAARHQALKQLEEPRAVAARRGLEADHVIPARLRKAEAAQRQGAAAADSKAGV